MISHILIISQYFYPEQFRINDLSQELVSRGYKVTVITGIPNYPQGRFFTGFSLFKRRSETWNGIEIIRLPIFPRGKGKISLALNYYSFVISGWFFTHTTKLHADVVLTYEVSPLLQAKLGNWYSKRFQVKHLLYVMDLWPENVEVVGGINNKLVLNYLKKTSISIYQKSSKILVSSGAFKSAIIDLGIDEKKLVYWPQYAEDFYKPTAPQPIWTKDNRTTIVYAGNLGVAQGLNVLLKSAILLKRKGIKTFRIILIGEGRDRDNLENLAANEGILDIVEFLNAVPALVVPGLISAADWVFISLIESKVLAKTIPAKLQTYFACAKPIIASIGGESARIINEAKAGLVSPPGDEVKLAINIQTAISMKKEDIGVIEQNAVEYSKTHFNRIMLINQLLSLMNEGQ